MIESSADILRLRSCPQCGYDLSGLPAKHSCPECGFEYDELMVAIQAWALDDEPKIAALVSSGVLTGLMALMTRTMIARGPVGSWIDVWPAAGLLIFGAGFAVLCRRAYIHLRGRSGLTLVLAARGYCVFAGGKGEPWRPWLDRIEAPVKRLRKGRWRLIVRRQFVRRLVDPRSSFVFTADVRTADTVTARVRQFMTGVLSEGGKPAKEARDG